MSSPLTPASHLDNDDAPEKAKPTILYRSFVVEGTTPEAFRSLTPTEFRVTEREGISPSAETLFIVPGFGVSVGQIGVDELLWNSSSRYTRMITHDAVIYRTTHEYVLWQYAQLLKQFPISSLNILGISLGGSTAVQLLAYLQKTEPELFAKCKKLLTLVSPVVETDLSARWQTVLKFCRQLAALNRQGDDAGVIKRIVLEALVGGVSPLVRRSSLEASTDEEVRNVFAYAGETFNGAVGLMPGSLDGVDIVSFGLKEDAMAPNTQACNYGKKPGRHITVEGQHTPRFYSVAKDTYDRMIFEELG